MGRIFLVAIVVGLAYGAYGIYGHITSIGTVPPAAQPATASAVAASVSPEGQDSGRDNKRLPARSSSQDFEPVPVVAHNCQWIQVEAWGIVTAGDVMPDGSTLESWDSKSVTVRTESGKTERRRSRTFLEAMAKLAPAVASVPVDPWNEKKP